MELQTLTLSSLRNISTAALTLHPRCNVIVGANGSGKTSLLEAIHLLSTGRSFRSVNIQPVIQYDETTLWVHGRLRDSAGHTHSLGIERALKGGMTAKLNQQEVKRLAELAAIMPLQLMNPDSYQLLNAGPALRRKFIDWGLFHVEPSFLGLWQRYHRVLRQRNAALKQQQSTDIWDDSFVELGEALAEQRKQYVKQLRTRVEEDIETLLGLEGVTLHYQRGWKAEDSLADVLITYASRDQRFGCSHYGPHRADFQLLYQGHPLDKVFSRGQQKVVVYALLIARGALLSAAIDKRCIYLIDDVVSELDATFLNRILKAIVATQSQAFITAIQPETIEPLLAQIPHHMFHVEQGLIKAGQANPCKEVSRETC